MSYWIGDHCVFSLGGFAEPPALEEVEFRQLVNSGALVRMRQRAQCPLERVTVMIHATGDGLMECALAEPNPVTGDWEYLRRTQHPAGQGLIMRIAALGLPPFQPTIIVFEAAEGTWRITAQCGHEIRVAQSESAPKYFAQCGAEPSCFGLRISEFRFDSDFGIRASGFPEAQGLTQPAVTLAIGVL